MELKFTQDVKDAWVAALRSGEYAQGTETLRHPLEENYTEYCCLGVLADVCGIWSRVYGNEVLKEVKYGSVVSTYILLSEETQATLTKMNDGGASFDHIAGYITAAVEAQP